MSNVAEDFQKELNSILESKPPISKAKMNSIVKAAIKSVKYYKHVVYFVEHFIKTVCNHLIFKFFVILNKLSLFCSVSPIIKFLVYMLLMQLYAILDINIYKMIYLHLDSLLTCTKHLLICINVLKMNK